MAEQSRTQNVKKNLVWGTINKILTIVLMFLVRTVIIYTLGIEYDGLGSLFTSVLNVLNLAELGLGNAMVFSMYKPVADGDSAKTGALLNYYRKCYRWITLIILGIGILLLPLIPWFIKDSETVSDVNIYILYVIYLANTLASYQFLAYKRALLLASQNNKVESNVLSIVTIVQNIVQIVILFTAKDYYLYIIMLPVGTIIFNLMCAKRCTDIFPEVKVEGDLSVQERKSIGQLMKGLVAQKIGGVVLTSVDSIVISAFLGLTILGIYNNYYYIIYAIFQILTVIMNALKSSVGNSIAVETVESNYRMFKILNFIYTWLVTWITVCLLCMMQDVVQIWVGSKLMLSSGMVILWCIYFFTHKWFDMLYVFQESAGLWWENRYVPGVAALVNLVVNLILIQLIGLAGVLLSTILSVIFVYDTGYAYVLFKYYFADMKKLRRFLASQVSFLVTAVFVGICTYYVTRYVCLSGIAGLAIKFIICLLVPNLLMLIRYCKNKELRASFVLLKDAIGAGR